MIKAIIFDYDGVIVDSFPSVHRVYQIICKKLGKKCPSNFEDFKKIYGYSSGTLSKNLGIEGAEIDEANRIYKKEIVKKMHPIFPGIQKVIEELSENYRLVILSSSPRKEVIQKLKKYKIDKEFKSVYASDKLGPMEKTSAIRKMLADLNLNPNEVIMVADRTIDFDKGIGAGLPPKNLIIVEYGWGYDHDKVPIQDPIVKKPENIIAAIESK